MYRICTPGDMVVNHNDILMYGLPPNEYDDRGVRKNKLLSARSTSIVIGQLAMLIGDPLIIILAAQRGIGFVYSSDITKVPA